jgi:signal transduction histidine kinase/ligand-binding sensor domain-containing protein
LIFPLNAAEKPNTPQGRCSREFLAMNWDLNWIGRRLGLGSILFWLVLLPAAPLSGTEKSNNSQPGHNSRPVKPNTADHRLAHGVAPRSGVEPNVVRLPVLDGDDIRFKHLPTTEGPSQTRVSQIVQDDLGFIWFGTQQGLNRYDGYKFKVFSHDPADPSSLGGVFVYSLFKDRSGVIWVGTDQSLDRFEPATESFTHFHFDRTDLIVGQIGQDLSGILWMATRNGLYRFDPTSQKFAHFHHEPGNPLSLSSDEIRSTGEDRQGRFWVLTSARLDEFDRTSGHVTQHLQLPELLSSVPICTVGCSFHVDRFGVFWIIYGSGNGVAVFNPVTNRLTRYSFYEQQPSDFALTGVNAILEDHNGTMWFGTMGDGLLKYDRNQQRFIRYMRRPGNPDSLAENRVIALFEDREGNIWTGFHARVPDSFSVIGPRFENFSPSSADPNGPGENLVSAIYEDKRNSLWIGAGGTLYRVNRKNGKYTRYYPAGPGATTDVLTIGEDRSGNLWVGTFGYGLSCLNQATGEFRTYRHKAADPSSLSNDTVTRIFIDHTGAMWVSTVDGLDRFDQTTGRFTVYKQDRNKVESYRSITEDKKGIFWIGGMWGTSGLIRFVPATGQFRVFLNKFGESNSLSDNTVDSSLQDRSGTLWIGTQNGLNKIDPETEFFSTYYMKNGLSGNAVSCILADERDNLWMSTNRGLSKFDPRTQGFENYSSADGLPGDDLTGWNACFKSPTGEMFFGGFAGAVAFRPDHISDSAYIPRIALTEFRLASGPVKIGPSSPLQKSITEARDLTLTHSQHFFSIEFSALSFRNPDTNRYRYKMDRLDSAWHEVGSHERVVNYDGLAAGVYEFQVEGATSRGAWSEPGVTLRIEILPAWWGTTWFRLITAVCILILLGSLYRLRLQQMAQRFSMRLEERVSERTRIARELHDTMLQSLQGLMIKFSTLTYIPNLPAEARERLKGLLEQGRQAVNEGREAVQGLRSSTVITNDLACALTVLGEELAAVQDGQNPAAFHVEVEGESRDFHPIVRDEIHRIASEAVRNAFHHARASRIEVKIRYDERQFRVGICDNGKGIDPTVLKGGGRAGHYGLPGMQERARSIGGKLTISSNPDCGTEMELTIPALLAYAKSRSPRRAMFLRRGA